MQWTFMEYQTTKGASLLRWAPKPLSWPTLAHLKRQPFAKEKHFSRQGWVPTINWAFKASTQVLSLQKRPKYKIFKFFLVYSSINTQAFHLCQQLWSKEAVRPPHLNRLAPLVVWHSKKKKKKTWEYKCEPLLLSSMNTTTPSKQI